MGQPTDLPPAVQEAICQAIRVSTPPEVAAVFVGVAGPSYGRGTGT